MAILQLQVDESFPNPGYFGADWQNFLREHLMQHITRGDL